MKKNLDKSYPKTQVKYPLDVANAELFNQNDLTNKQKKDILYRNKIERLENENFNLNGAYPYLIDLINYICTHHKETIERKNNPAETHYRIIIPKDAFIEIILGKYKEQYKYLKKEIYRLISGLDEENKKIKKKVLPLNMTEGLLTKPIKLEIIYHDNKKIPVSQLSLKGITGEGVKGYIIEFYKPLWKKFLTKNKGKAWFPLPHQFHAKMTHFIKEFGKDSEFIKYGNFGNISNYRKLYLFLSSHDNSKSNQIKYDAIELTKTALPQNIHTNNEGQATRLRSWYTSHQFLQKGIRLFYRMGKEKLLNGVKLIPTSVWYDKPLRNLVIKINRDNKALPEFKNNVDEDKEKEVW